MADGPNKVSTVSGIEVGPRSPGEKLSDLDGRRGQARNAASPKAVERQHAKGKKTARERIDAFLDPGTFVELDALARHQATGWGIERNRPYGDAVVTGWGKVEGRTVCVFSQDFTVFGGSLGTAMSKKMCKVMDMADSVGVPIVGLNDSGGARIQEGVVSLDAYAEIMWRNVRSSGVVPQISVIMGPCAGGAVYSPAMTDFVFMVKGTSHMFITGPNVVRAVTGEDVTQEELGGAMTHAAKTGVADAVAVDEEQCFEDVRHLLSFLPSNNAEAPPHVETGDDPDRLVAELDTFLPESTKQAYDTRDLIRLVVDGGEFFELQPLWAANMVIGYARLNGNVVGVLANQPQVLAGCLDIESSEKAARFVRTCDAFNIPTLTLVDVPGFLPGTNQEYGGIIRHGAKLMYAYSEATAPRLQLVVRKSYGGAYVVMNARSIGCDYAVAWPTAELAVMAGPGAVNIIGRRTMAEADDPEYERQRLIAQYTDDYCTPYVAAESGLVDEVIRPSETRRNLCKALEMLLAKRKRGPVRKHGNIPL